MSYFNPDTRRQQHLSLINSYRVAHSINPTMQTLQMLNSLECELYELEQSQFNTTMRNPYFLRDPLYSPMKQPLYFNRFMNYSGPLGFMDRNYNLDLLGVEAAAQQPPVTNLGTQPVNQPVLTQPVLTQPLNQPETPRIIDQIFQDPNATNNIQQMMQQLAPQFMPRLDNPNQPLPVRRDTILTLPEHITSALPNENRTCAICITPLERNDMTATQCGHFFHKNCLETSVNTHGITTCPTCRTNIVKMNDEILDVPCRTQ